MLAILFVIYAMMFIGIRLATHKKQIIYVYVIGMLFFMFLLPREHKNVYNVDSFAFNAVIGAVLAYPAVLLTAFIVSLKKPLIEFGCKMDSITFAGIICEELVWRNFLLLLVNKYAHNKFAILLTVLIVTGLFVLAHNNFDSVSNIVEMFLFSIILVIMALFFSGANIGMHVVRNFICCKRESGVSDGK